MRIFPGEANQSAAGKARPWLCVSGLRPLPHMTVFENVAFGLRARKDTKDLPDRVREALRVVHLEDFETR